MMIESVRLNGSFVDVIWSSTARQTAGLRLSIFDAFELLDYLQRAFKRGIVPVPSVQAIPENVFNANGPEQEPVGTSQFKGTALKGNCVSVQWCTEAGEWSEIKLPINEAIRFMLALENCLPIERNPTQDRRVDFGEPVPVNQLQKLWIPAYRADRYLESLSLEQLAQRHKDIVGNLMRLDDDRKYRPKTFYHADGNYETDRDIDWRRLLKDLDVETDLRGKKPDEKVSADQDFHLAERLADESWCWRPDLVDKSWPGTNSYERPKLVFKFGKEQWNRRIFEKGEIRFNPASNYKDASLNQAIHDDELQLEYLDAEGVEWTVLVGNYHVFCMTSVYDYRFYRDFADNGRQADSCLVIHDVEAFQERIYNRAKIDLKGKTAGFVASPVIYLDPLNTIPPETAEEVRFAKHFRYAYQYEYRLAWPAIRNDAVTEPLDLTIGSIEDIAELIVDTSSEEL